MLFEASFEFLKDIIGKSMTIGELNQKVLQTECFEPVNCYLLTNCIDSKKKQCSFNSFENSKRTYVINIDISFLNNKDFKIIKNMSWTNSEKCNFMMIKVMNVYLYEI